VETYPLASGAAVERALERASGAFATWRRTPVDERTAALGRIGVALEAQARELASLMALEMGKPVAEGEAEAKKCAWACRWYAEQAAGLLEPRACESDGSRAWVRHEPLGPILAIMPWNFPFWQFFRFAAPALAAGNVVLLKHAPNTPGCGLRIETLVNELRAGAQVVISGARHELMMERDAFREQFWAAFDAFVPGSRSGDGAT